MGTASSTANMPTSQGLAVALSGGGHRATLFHLGVLLALVDRGLNSCVQQIASVSGGSIANAFVAINCDFPNTNITDFDGIVASLVSKIVHKGVLTRPIIIGILTAILAPPLIVVWLGHHGTIPWLLAIPMGVAWLCLGLLRGLIVEWLLELRYFPPKISTTKFPPFFRLARQCISCLNNRSVEHVIWCTDLVERRPVNFLLKEGRLLSLISLTEWTKQLVSHLPIASVVRASAAFPGIPPRRFRLWWQKPHRLIEPAERPVKKNYIPSRWRNME